MKHLLDSFPAAPARSVIGFDFLTDEDLAAFTYTQIASGTAAVLDANDVSANGILRFGSVDATENKGAQIQLDAESFQLVAGKDLRFLARFAIGDADQGDCLHGFAITNATLIASAPTDGIYFRLTDGSPVISLIARAGNATVLSVPIATLTDAAFVTLAFEILGIGAGGAGTLVAYVNGTEVSRSAVTGLPTTEALALSHAFESGAAAIQTMDLDLTACDKAR